MEVNHTSIPGCFEIFPRVFEDSRGRLVKTFHHDLFADNGLETDFREEYYSVSHKSVLRGLHFQVPPHEHIKLVTCLEGSIFDVVVDLRKGSPSFGRHLTFIVDALKGNMVYVPAGCAHGFYVLSDKALFLNRTTSVFSSPSDAGIKWNTCGIEWPDANPVLSDKDHNLPSLHEYNSPFVF